MQARITTHALNGEHDEGSTRSVPWHTIRLAEADLVALQATHLEPRGSARVRAQDVRLGLRDQFPHARPSSWPHPPSLGPALRELVRVWRLEAGEYQPWTPDAVGRWKSQELAIAFGIEDGLAAVYSVEGSRQLREGEISEALSRKDAE